MEMSSVYPRKKGLLQRVQEALAGLARCRQVNLHQAYQLKDDKVRVPLEGFPIQLILGDNGRELCLYPEGSMTLNGGSSRTGTYILFDPARFDNQISGFLRLVPNSQLELGRRDPDQQAIFDYPESVADRHLVLKHEGRSVVFRDTSGVGTCIAPLVDEARPSRLHKLRRIREIFGGRIELLPKDEALALIEKVIALQQRDPYRKLDASQRPGGLIELPKNLTPVIVGDLHTQVDNLLVILTQNAFLEGLENGSVCLIIIGDAVHSEVDGEMDKMDSSMLTMDLIFRLKVRFPQQVFYMRGNHDSFSEEIAKDGIPQGLLWSKALRATRGKKYREAMAQFYEHLPYVAMSKHFVTCHAAPPRSRISRTLLVDIRRYPGLIPELINNRMQRPNRPAGYTAGDVKRFRKSLDLAPTTPLIVGHTPWDRTDTLWLNVGGIQDHHVVFSAAPRCVGAFTRVGSRMIPLRYPAEPLLPIINSLEPPESSASRSR